MSYKIKFTKLCSNIDEIKFKCKCESCEILTSELKDQKCYFCNRYFHYVSDTNCVIYTFKNMLAELALRKNLFNDMSWFDFQNLECKLTDLADKNVLFQYNNRNFSFYIDFCDYEQNFNTTIETICSMNEILVKELGLSKPVLNQANDHAKNELAKCGTNKKINIIYANICLTNVKQQQIFTINREKLYEMFCEKIDFLN